MKHSEILVLWECALLWIMLLSASMEGNAVHACGGMLTERYSPRPVVDYGVAKELGRCVGMGESQGMQYSPTNGYQIEMSRTLVHAYGTEKSLECRSSKPFLVEQKDRNCIDNKMWSKSWQDTEEKEFDWNDIKPTLIDHSRNNSLTPSTVGFSTQTPVVAVNTTLSKQDAAWNGWSHGSRFPPLNNSSAMANSLCSSQIPHHFSNSSQHNLDQARTLTNPQITDIRNNVKPPSSVAPPSFERAPFVNQNVNSFVPAQSYGSVENKDASITKMHQFPKKLPGHISFNQKNHWQAPQPQLFQFQDPSTSHFSHGMSSWQGYGASTSTAMLNPFPDMQSPLPLQSIAEYPLHAGHPPASPQMMTPPTNIDKFLSTQQRPVGYTDLLTYLMSQGIISLDKLRPAQNSIGTEFNADILKVRREE